MDHASDIESRSNPDGLQEIRSWASRSPGAARPGFRARQPGGFRFSPRLVASIGSALLLLLVLAGYRSLRNGRDPGDPPPVFEPEPEQVASAPVPVEDAPPVAEVIAEAPRYTEEPVPTPAILPWPAPVERSQKEPEAVQLEPALEEPRAASEIVVSRDLFESEPAVLLSAPVAEYPESARGTGTSARVIVGFTVDETGTVRNPVIERTWIQGDAPKAPFEQAALIAIRSASFTPAREGGVPVRSWSTLTFSFESGPPSVDG